MRVRLDALHPAGLVVKRRFSGRLTIAYGEILTAERLRSRRGLMLHTRTLDKVRLLAGRDLEQTEAMLRRGGVRIVDCWGAIIAPTLLDFENELAREPVRVRQSSDNA